MKSDFRAIVAFAAVGVVLVGLALLLSSLSEPASPIETLPLATAPSSAVPSPRAAALPPPDSVRRLIYEPTLSRTQIAFTYAGEIWTIPRDGGEARRLVTGQLRNYRPMFSPDGSQIAFTGIVDSNPDVYVVPASGGEPHRLTYHPGPDTVAGWSPDGKSVLFSSTRDTARDLPKLFTVPLTGGFATELPLPSGTEATFSPDGKRVAYVPFPQFQPAWKKYRGGQTTRVWIADLADSKVTKVPREESNDRAPMWIGSSVYFLSDRNGPTTLFGFDPSGGAVRELVPNADGFDISYASAGPDAIVYAQADQLFIYDTTSSKTHRVPFAIRADLPQLRPHFERVNHDQILHAAISPTGKRVLFETRGEILAVPAEKGDTRNLSHSPGVADRDPAWSPDGKWIAWLSDEPGEYALYIRAPDGVGPVKKVDLGSPASFWYSPRWSPDSKKIVLWDKRLNLWLIDLEHPTPVKVDTARFSGADFDPSWSPDSRWLAYMKLLPNFRQTVFLYSLDDKSIHQVTDGRSDSSSPRFDRSGKYLWLLSSTDVGMSNGNGMTSMARPVTSSVYAVVLAKDQPSPVAPESDEEGGDAGAHDAKANKAKAEKGEKGEKGDKPEKPAPKKVEPTKIDFEGLDQRIVALPIERAKYIDLQPGAEGVLFLLSEPTVFADEDYTDYDDDNPAPHTITRFTLKKRKSERFADKAGDMSVSADGTKVLFGKDKKWFVVSADEPAKDGEGTIKIDGVEVWVDPQAEWRQMYREVWRVERDFLYDPNAHGLDLAATEKLYGNFLDGIGGREDLKRLIEEALSNLVLGHVRSPGGAFPKQDRASVGLLGANYKVEEGRYRFAKILSGENWNPKLRAPLTEPGLDVKEGEFLLSVNGQDLKGDDDVDRFFLGTAGKQTFLTVGPKASGTGSRQIIVVPVGNDGGLRLRTWMDDNRKKVSELSGGRVGYVYLPDTRAGGFANFNRYYFAEVGKDAVVLDERFNHGGSIADYMIDIMKWTPLMGSMTREGEDQIVPSMAIFGPKVMIANEMSGSGGDALPWMFKNAALGPLVGTRTWGGLVGVGGYPRLIDGGNITAPRWGLYGMKGEWEVENHGIAPDVEVEEDPLLMRAGHDPQLERAVQLALDALAKTPPTKLARPPFPNYHPKLPALPPP
jgi:tricorn protease